MAREIIYYTPKYCCVRVGRVDWESESDTSIPDDAEQLQHGTHSAVHNARGGMPLWIPGIESARCSWLNLEGNACLIDRHQTHREHQYDLRHRARIGCSIKVDIVPLKFELNFIFDYIFRVISKEKPQQVHFYGGKQLFPHIL